MTAIPLTDEQADRIDEHPAAIGTTEEVATLIRMHIMDTPDDQILVTFTRPCPDGDDWIFSGVKMHTRKCLCGGSGRVPVTVWALDSHLGGRWSRTYATAERAQETANNLGHNKPGYAPWVPVRIPAVASVVHVIPAVKSGRMEQLPSVTVGESVLLHTQTGPGAVRVDDLSDLRWSVGDAPWVLLLKWK